MPRILIVLSVLVSAGTALTPLALAQDAGERINQVIVYGDDPCPVSDGAEITVCARKEEAERYRIPEILRDTESPENDAWNNRVLAYETIGKHGVLSCSPVGPGGSTGCVSQLIDTAYAEKGIDPSVRFGELIAAEREKRLSTIDEQASETQERVEEAERDYVRRQREGQDPATAPGEQDQ